MLCSSQTTKHDPKEITFYNKLLTELQCQFRTSIPTTLSLLLYKIPWLISLHFVGNIGPDELAAAALATTLCNVTGMSLSVGLNSAITTLTGQARGLVMMKRRQRNKMMREEEDMEPLNGEPNRKGYESMVVESSSSHILSSNLDDDDETTKILPITYLYRGIFVQMMLVIPIGMYWLHGVKPMLLALGQGETLSQMTEEYLRILTPGLFSYSINFTLTSWLQSIEMADIPAYAAFIGLVTHIPFNILFIYTLDWGYKGAAFATVLFQLIQPLVLIVYLWYIPPGKKRLKRSGGDTPSHIQSWKTAILSLKGIVQFLNLAIPGIIIISEWWASEIAIFLGGRLSPDPSIALDGMTIYQSINTFCFMFPVGASVGGSTRIGNLLGENDTNGASFAAKISIWHACVWSLTMGMILWFVPHTFFPSFFTPDVDVIRETSKTISFLAFYVVADGLQNALSGIVKGCGKQCINMPIVLVAYWVVGLPLAYYITFKRNGGEMYDCELEMFCGDVGLVAGMTAGTYVHFMLMTVVICAINWKEEGMKAQKRLGLEMKVRGGDEEKISLLNGVISDPMLAESDCIGMKKDTV